MIELAKSRGWRLFNSLGVDIEANKVAIGTQQVAKLKRLLFEKVGTLDPFLVSFGRGLIPF